MSNIPALLSCENRPLPINRLLLSKLNVAIVACPHKSTSELGVKKRTLKVALFDL